ncbi:hypothetical protein AC812_16290, partial [Bellilinea caldifistulae]
MKRLNLVWVLLIAVSLVISACQPAVETIEVEKEVVKTEVVEKVVEVEKQPTEEQSFSTPHPILSDVRVRQAMAYC